MLVLVVDDDALSRDVLTLLLEAEGYGVQSVESGEEAVARLTALTLKGAIAPDVVLTDVQMPGLAGDRLAKALRPMLPAETVLLAISGSQPTGPALENFDGFLLKPFTIAELSSMIPGDGHSSTEPQERVRHSPSGEERNGPVLDEDIYAKMSDLMPRAQLGQMYLLCLADARRRIAIMASLAAGGDDARFRSEAHAIKGGSGMIGASELYTLAAAAEDLGIFSGQPSSGTSTITATLTQLSRACDKLERILLQRAPE